MAKQKNQQRPEPRPLIPPKYQHYAAIGAILLALIIFFHDALFSGKVFIASDSLASQSFIPFLQDARDAGIYPLWVPYIFCGMPSFASLLATPARSYDITSTVVAWGHEVFTFFLRNPEVTSVLFYYFIFGISTYFFMIHKKKSSTVALFTSLSTLFSTYVIILIMVGHNTKIASICLLPIVLMMIEKMIDDFQWWHGIVLVLAIHIQQLASHIQFFFYSYLLIGIYYLYLLIVRIVKKEQWALVLRSGVVFALAAAFSFAMSADIYLSTLEYNPYSIRGSNPIVQTPGESQTKTAAGGLDYEYATNWSFSPGEVLTFVLPSLYGFGGQIYKGPLTENQEQRLNTYWGQMPWTDAPQYMGIVVLVLAMIGIYYNRSDRFVQAMVLVSILSILISFGRTFSPVYDLMYYYFPTFNKFRIPSMILILVQLIMPILAGFGLQSIVDKGREKFSPEAEKKFKYILGGAGVLFVLGFVARGFFEDLYRGFVGNDGLNKLIANLMGRQSENVLAQVRPMIFDFLFDGVMTDYIVATLLLAVVFGLAYAYRKHRIAATTFVLTIIGLSLGDLWRIDLKPMELHDKSMEAAALATPDYVKVIQQDTSLYRVLNTENLRQPSNDLAYFKLQSVGGYHGAKIRIYQDIVDVATLANPTVWVLMNMKYIIADLKENLPGVPVVFQGQTKKVLEFPPGSQRAWFVDSIAVDSGLGILDRMRDNSFDPHHVAYFEEKPGFTIDRPDTSAKVTVKDFGIHNVSFNVEASGNNLLYVSEIYYPKGWEAFIDGNPTKIYKTDYAFRSVLVPKGEHLVEFKFHPTTYYLGRTVSLGTNILAWSAMFVTAFFWWRMKRKSP
ncbi:MAG TPA: YfhO family protein [Bacteroidota bacterium]|nr:YfhO family protein [Bacteroidota bacterium]